MHKLEGFVNELNKEALRAPTLKSIRGIVRKISAHGRKIPKKETYGKTFTEGAKRSVPWLLGFHALEQASKPPHVTLDEPREKKKRLIKNIGTGAAGWGAWDVATRAIGSKKKSGIGTIARMINRGKGRKGLKLIPKALKRFPRGAAALGAGLAAGSAVEGLAGKLMNSKPPKEIPLNRIRR